jgi:hypothetical protein
MERSIILAIECTESAFLDNQRIYYLGDNKRPFREILLLAASEVHV